MQSALHRGEGNVAKASFTWDVKNAAHRCIQGPVLYISVCHIIIRNWTGVLGAIM